jgi:hypothetical protein
MRSAGPTPSGGSSTYVTGASPGQFLSAWGRPDISGPKEKESSMAVDFVYLPIARKRTDGELALKKTDEEMMNTFWDDADGRKAKLDDLLSEGYRIVHSSSADSIYGLFVCFVLHKVNAPGEVVDVALTEAGEAALESEKVQ